MAGKLGMPVDDAKIQDGFVKLAVQNARLGEWWIQELIATELALDEQMKKLPNDAMEQQLAYPQLGSGNRQIVPKYEDATAKIKRQAQLSKKQEKQGETNFLLDGTFGAGVDSGDDCEVGIDIEQQHEIIDNIKKEKALKEKKIAELQNEEN